MSVKFNSYSSRICGWKPSYCSTAQDRGLGEAMAPPSPLHVFFHGTKVIASTSTLALLGSVMLLTVFVLFRAKE